MAYSGSLHRSFAQSRADLAKGFIMKLADPRKEACSELSIGMTQQLNDQKSEFFKIRRETLITEGSLRALISGEASNVNLKVTNLRGASLGGSQSNYRLLAKLVYVIAKTVIRYYWWLAWHGLL